MRARLDVSPRGGIRGEAREAVAQGPAHPDPGRQPNHRLAPRRRAPNLNGSQLEAVVRIIGHLPGKPTWAAVIEAVQEQLGASYTRQALHAHTSILLAVQARKHGRPAKPEARSVSARSQAIQKRIQDLKEENEVLRRREAVLLEQFMRWAYNAHAYGMTEAMLDRPLPAIERG